MGTGDDLKVTWKECFSVGDDLIDRQHRAFFDEINAVATALESGDPRDAVIRFYRRFYGALIQHFRDEEAMLARIAYDGLDGHQAEHGAMLAAVAAVEEMLLTSKGTHELHFVVKSLFRTLIEHLVIDDMRYKTFVLRAQGL